MSSKTRAMSSKTRAMPGIVPVAALTTALAAAGIATLLSGCEFIAVQTAPTKIATVTRLPSAENADLVFWNTLHGGDYAGIQKSLDALTAAYLENPRDATTAAHIGWMHIWRLSERSRIDTVPATITDDAVLARRYFQEAVALDPGDARYLGFLGSAMLAEGSINQDERQIRQGYFTLKRAIHAWPEFNLFTAGYVLSSKPADSAQFKEGLAWQWQDLEACAGARLDRDQPDYRQYMPLETVIGQKRVCWNSWIAPHNFEGFFMNMGDMLVKSGDWQTGQRMYANARLSRTYQSWPFRQELEQRIEHAHENVGQFNAPNQLARGASVMMINSRHSCMACHQG